MIEIHETLRKSALEIVAKLPEDDNRANGVMMILADDLQEQIMTVSRMGSHTALKRDTAVNLASAVLRCKREIESICAADGIELPRTGETYPEP